MSGLLWYVCLSGVSLAVAVWVILLKWRAYGLSTLVTFYLFAAGVTWIGEFVVLGLFNGYAYKTGLIPDIWAQDIIGHMLLNTTMYPAAAVLVAACSLGYAWFPVIAAVFISIEFLFLKLGIYEHHWWRYYMSAIVVFTFLFSFGYHMAEALLTVVFFCILKRWYWKFAPFSFPFILHGLYSILGISVNQNGWKPVYTILLNLLSLFALFLLEKYSLRPGRNKPMLRKSS